MTNEPAVVSQGKQTDTMLLIAAGAVVAIGIVWLLISQPWSSAAPAETAETSTAAAAADAQSTPAVQQVGVPAESARQPSASLDNPLRLARMAYDAGMLIEPADYSAWTLYSRALTEHGGSDEARAGLEMVAADLLSRGSVAVEQGRLDDAEATVQEILKVLPEHADAVQLAAVIAERRAPPPPPLAARPPVVRPEAERAARTTVERPEVAPPPPLETDPIPPLSDSFNNALASNALLTPADASASYYARQMLAARPDDARSLSARDLLVTEMLGRSRQSIEALDMDAARTWVDAAETLGGNRDAIEEGRADLLIAQVRQESAKPVPASELVVANYVAPAYPRTPLSRGIEGWVDIEFTVGEDGNTRDIVVADASHKSYFRNEAVEAVSGWRFEPRIFMGEVLTQRSYTRVAFVLEN